MLIVARGIRIEWQMDLTINLTNGSNNELDCSKQQIDCRVRKGCEVIFTGYHNIQIRCRLWHWIILILEASAWNENGLPRIHSTLVTSPLNFQIIWNVLG